MLTKKDLEHLAALARLDLKAGAAEGEPRHRREEEKLQKDLGSILDYFKELQEADTENVLPMAGGTELKNITREDIIGKTDDTGRGPEQFPDKQGGFLKVPPVF